MQGGRWGRLGGCGASLRNLNLSEKQWELPKSLKQGSAGSSLKDQDGGYYCGGNNMEN